MHQIPSVHFRESGNVQFSSEGWIYSEVRIESVDISLGGLDFWSLSNVFVENLDNINLDAWKNSDPQGDNMDLSIRFVDLSIDDALSATSEFIVVLDQILSVDLYFDSFDTYQEFRGEYVTIIEIRYRGNVDWYSIEQLCGNALPRSMGGLSEDVDITTTNNLGFNIYYSVDFNDFVTELKLGWNTDWDSLYGSHIYSLLDLFHVSQLRCSDQATEPLNLHINLPDVTGLTLTPWLNSTGIEMFQYYRPNTEEPWYLDNTYEININILQGYSLSDVTLQFDYDVHYWGITPRERAWYEVDPKGYERLEIQLEGPNAKLTSSTDLNESLLSDVQQLHFEYYKTAYEVANHTAVWLDISYIDDLDHQSQADAIASFFENLLGQNFNNNFTCVNSYWDDNLQQNKQSSCYGYEIYVLDFASFQPVYLASKAYTHSSMINSSSYGLAFDRFNWDIELDTRYNVFNYHIRIEYDELNEYREFPVKGYVESTTPQIHTFDVLDLFGWTTLPYSSTSESFEIELRFPIEEISSVTINPENPDGWGYQYWSWKYHEAQFRYENINIRYYVGTPYTKDEFGQKESPVSTWSGFFNFSFYS
ncbi:MAG: hypothetical protein ACTSSF_13295, partial [Candidatus Heimdallarchaeaceae archaeon]